MTSHPCISNTNDLSYNTNFSASAARDCNAVARFLLIGRAMRRIKNSNEEMRRHNEKESDGFIGHCSQVFR